MKKVIFIIVIVCSATLFSKQNLINKLDSTERILDGKIYTLNNFGKNTINIMFNRNKITGKSTINTYEAIFDIEDTKIKISDIEATKMKGPNNLMKDENEYFELLANAEDINIKGDILTIKTKDNKELIFKEQAELSPNYLKGKEFILKNAFNDLNITIGFTKNYIYGYNDIDKYLSSYKITDDKIFIKDIKHVESTEKETNEKYIELFSNIHKISLENDELILITKDKEKLIYKMKF